MRYKFDEIDSSENPYLITWVIHNSRYEIKIGLVDLYPKFLSEIEQNSIKKYINDKAEENNIKIEECSVLTDHVHLIIICKKTEIETIIKLLKGYSSYMFFKSYRTDEKYRTKNVLWARKYNISFINDIISYENAINYVKNNKNKHEKTEKFDMNRVL
ncbi:IS200/IS605 family transposase [bacterium]|nr:IS200/IS605 family transposase [bacterium]